MNMPSLASHKSGPIPLSHLGSTVRLILLMGAQMIQPALLIHVQDMIAQLLNCQKMNWQRRDALSPPLLLVTFGSWKNWL